MITIIDYGMGNIGSLENMIKRVGGTSRVTSQRTSIAEADKLILPGVGQFDQAMKQLQDLDLVETIDEAVTKRKVPILCICLGAQLVTESSQEGELRGFGWIKGRTVKFTPDDKLRIPHMGWNDVQILKESPLLRNMPKDPCFYFVHSYYMVADNPEDVLTKTIYGLEFVSALEHENIYAVQFHPEKSHKYGMCIMKNFVELQGA